MKANNREQAWQMADRLFPTDYVKDEVASERAGYPIYKSTSTDNEFTYAHISDLNTRLEVCDGNKTTNIWIEEQEVKGMKATVRSLTNGFEEYTICGIVGVQFVANTLVLTYIKDNDVKTTSYNTNTVMIDIH